MSAMWDRESTMTFCDICLRQIELGNRPNTCFTKEGWLNILSKFKELTGRNYDRTKLKNKWDQLKKDWKIWKELKRGSTGLGWDPLKRTIDASPEWWAEKLQAVPTAKKFKVSGIDPVLEEKLDGMFSGVVATGSHVFTADVEGSDGLQNYMETEDVGESGEGPSESHPDVQSTGGTKRPRGESSRKGAGFVRCSIEELLKSCKAKPEEPKTITIKECIQLLNTYPDIKEDRAMYLKYVKLLGNSTRREFFANLDPEFRLDYLRSFMTD